MRLSFFSLANDALPTVIERHPWVRVTGDTIRDEDDRIVARVDPITGAWSRTADGLTYNDILIAEQES